MKFLTSVSTVMLALLTNSTAENIDGLYYPKKASGWSCNIDDIGMDKGTLGILSSKIYGLENTCELSNPKRNGDEWTFTQECFGEGSFDESEISLSKTNDGVLFKKDGREFEWTSCPNKTLFEDVTPNQTQADIIEETKPSPSDKFTKAQDNELKNISTDLTEVDNKLVTAPTGRIYQSNDETSYELTCNANVLTMTEKSEFVDLPNPDTLYLSDSCSAFNPKHGLGGWSWANGGFGAELTHKDIMFPSAEIICEKEPEFVNSCGFSAAQGSPFVVDNCTFKLEGEQQINGKCWIDILEGGSFSLRTYDSSSPFSVYIKNTGKRSANGYHNGGDSEQQAHIPMGRLMKSGYCWSNQISEVCTNQIAGKLLNKLLLANNTRLSWKVKKPYIDSFGKKACEVSSTQGLGLRFYQDGKFILALIDVPRQKIEASGDYAQIQSVLFFDSGYTYGTQLEVWDKKIDDIGRKQLILGLGHADGHVYDGLIKSKNLYVVLGGKQDLFNKDEIRRNASMVYSLKGSAKSIQQALNRCK